MGGTAFATVGTTKFDGLVEALDTAEVQGALWDKGFRRLLVQRGKSTREPSQRGKLPVEVYQFKTSLADDVASADLIISHAGAGSVMESLRAGKPLIVVANEGLMDNHQLELAGAMADKRYLYQATPATLGSVVRGAVWGDLEPLPPLDHSKLKYEILDMVGSA